jgi:hypothetical protein
MFYTKENLEAWKNQTGDFGLVTRSDKMIKGPQLREDINNRIETHFGENSKTGFSHRLYPGCVEKPYPNV